jgi:hypothetical protein
MASPKDSDITHPNHLNMTVDQAFFPAERRSIEGIIVSIYQNERPLAGLAGLLDWRFRGAISHHVRAGFITGKEGECVYLPLSARGQTYHLLLVGAGTANQAGDRGALPALSVSTLKKNLLSLRLPKIGISRSDFENQHNRNSFEQLLQNLKGLPLWTIQ